MNNEIIATSLGLPALPKTDEVIYKPETNDHALEDYTKARESIHAVVDELDKAIEAVAQLADTSQSTKYYENLNALLKTKIEAARELMGNQKAAKDLNKHPGDDAKQVTNNNLFVGTTAELANMLKQIDDEK